MQTVSCLKAEMISSRTYAHIKGKCSNAAAAVAAHHTATAVGIVILHHKIQPLFLTEYHQSVGTNAAIGSRFLKELPEEDIVRKGTTEPRRTSYQDGWGQYNYQPKPVIKELAYKPAPAAASVDFNKGDMVLHTAFGQGMVLSVLKMGGDALLEIAFDQIGTKKLMSKTASVHMKKL